MNTKEISSDDLRSTNLNDEHHTAPVNVSSNQDTASSFKFALLCIHSGSNYFDHYHHQPAGYVRTYSPSLCLLEEHIGERRGVSSRDKAAINRTENNFCCFLLASIVKPLFSANISSLLPPTLFNDIDSS